MDLSMEIDEDEDIQKPKKRKRTNENPQKIDDAIAVASSRKRNIKGIILSVTKPSYILKKGLGREIRSLRLEHRNRLRYLLRQLIRRQNWDEASGVLSLLLKGTHKDNGLSTNRTKYWATLELIQHMVSEKSKPRKIRHVFDIWMKKNFAITKNRRYLKGRFDVQLEFLLYCLSQGDSDGAHQAVISFLQETDFTSDPKANLVAGLAFSHLWYNSIQKEMQFQFHDSLESPTPIQSSGLSGIDHSNSCMIEVQDSDSGSVFKRDSHTSIRIGKTIDENRVMPDYKIKKEIKYEEEEEEEEKHVNSNETDQTRSFSKFPHTGNKQYGSVFFARDLESFLMPIKFPSTNELEEFVSFQKRIQTDHYKAAIKHLKGALHSTPPAFEALLPLIQAIHNIYIINPLVSLNVTKTPKLHLHPLRFLQMLLFGDQVKEAIEEIESIVQISNATLPFRIKASLQEIFCNEDVNKLCTCFEETLKKDPTCSHSLSKLITFHYDGFYSSENLVEMIGLHLDATYADCHIWREFASCFLRLSQCEEDRMSSCVGDDKIKLRQNSKNTPNMFKNHTSRKTWRVRCRWWLTRHFAQTILESELATSGNMELLAYKASSASHLYGSEFGYVVKVCKYLRKKRSQERSDLKMHMKNAIGIFVG
ncbi:hypothetical protein LXL04_001945 [Taraxacum kok-saghyz]